MANSIARPPRNSPEEVERLVNENLPLAEHMARQQFERLSFPDPHELRSQAMAGLLRAAETYDPGNRQGANFGTWAIIWIKQKFFADYHRKRAKKRGGGNVSHVALDCAVGDADLEAFLADENAANAFAEMDGKNVATLLEEVLPVLDARERRIIEGRFGLDGADPLTLDELGNEFHLTRERIRQLEVKAIEKLRLAIRRAEQGCAVRQEHSRHFQPRVLRRSNGGRTYYSHNLHNCRKRR